MVEQYPTPPQSTIQPPPASSAARPQYSAMRYRVGPLILLGFGIVLGLGALWWLAFWLNAGTITDIQFTGMQVQEYQMAIRMMLITGVFGLLVPAALVIALGMHLRRRWS